MTPLTPEHLEAQELRRKIAALFADGRERTTNDVALATGATVSRARSNLRKMLNMRLVTTAEVAGLSVWARRPQGGSKLVQNSGGVLNHSARAGK